MMIDIEKILEYDPNFWLDNGFGGHSNCYENIKRYIENYPSQGRKFVIAEEDYIDKNFLIDYVNFYSRCFDDLKRKTIRYHFFYSETKQELIELLNSLIEPGKTNGYPLTVPFSAFSEIQHKVSYTCGGSFLMMHSRFCLDLSSLG